MSAADDNRAWHELGGYDMGGWGRLVAAGERAAKAAVGRGECVLCVNIIKSQEGREAKKSTRDSART